MKRAFLILIIFSCCLFVRAQEASVNVKSKIEHVTVFLEGAQITRLATVPMKQGISLLTFQGVSPNVQEQSIQVNGPSAVKILSVSFRINYLEEIKSPEKIAALEEERRKLWASLAQEESILEVYVEEEAILKTNKSIGGTAKGTPIEELKVAMDYFRQRLMDIKERILLANSNIKKLKESIGRIDVQLRELGAVTSQPTGEIIVKVSAKTPVSAPITINYLVNEARWFPSYDIRAKNIQSPISITYKANVTQHTGEDWQSVALTISSGNPTQAGAKPIIKPWILGFNNIVASGPSTAIGTVREEKVYGPTNSFVRGRITDDKGEGMPGVNVLIKGTTIGTSTDAAGYYSIPLNSDAQTLVCSFIGYAAQEINISNRNEIDIQMVPEISVLQEVVVTGYGERSMKSISGSVAGVRIRGASTYTPKIKRAIVATPVVRQTHVEYTLEEPFSVKSDGEMRTTDMVEYELDALYEYYCVPKLDADAFLVAKVLNWDEHNFLEGEANLFFEGKYIGKSILDTRNTSDTLSLSLGRDGNVLVTREKKKDYTSRHVIGSNQKLLIGYEISIRNKKAQPLTIVIEDQIPITNDKEISVDKIEASNAELDEETGLMTWKKKIDPGKTEMISMKYAVRFPKGSQMILE